MWFIKKKKKSKEEIEQLNKKLSLAKNELSNLRKKADEMAYLKFKYKRYVTINKFYEEAEKFVLSLVAEKKKKVDELEKEMKEL